MFEAMASHPFPFFTIGAHGARPVLIREESRMRLVVLTVMAALLSAAAEAHVRIAPAESRLRAMETYAARVPTEGKVTTTSVQLDVPDGVTIVSVIAPAGASSELKRDGDRVVAVAWTTDIKPGEVAMLSFVARNPTAGGEIVWKVHQHYSDDTTSEWTGPAGSWGPAPVTRLLPAAR